MKKSFYLGMLMLIFSVTTYAQENVTNDKPMSIIHSSLQIQGVNFTGFNQQLNSLNLLPMPSFTPELGIGFSRLSRRYLFDVTIAGGNDANETDNIQGPISRFRYGGIRLRESLNILNPKGDWFFGPELGINISYEQMLVTGSNNARNFQEAAAYAVFNFERFSETFDLGLRIHKFIPYTDWTGNQLTMMISLRAGYRIDPGLEEWNFNQAIPIENLGANTGGLFAAFAIGFNIN